MFEPAPDPWAAAMRSAFDNAPIGMAVAAPDGTIMAANNALRRLLRAAGDELLGRPLFDRVHPDDRLDAVAACTRLHAEPTGTIEHECRFLLPEHGAIHVRVTSSRVDQAASDGLTLPPHVVMHLEDITESRGREDQLRRAALHDPLTGLPNRALLTQLLQSALDARRQQDDTIVALFLDLDQFKAVNDQHGHAAGDAVLVAAAERIRTCLRQGDIAARVGGDEFVVLCPGLPLSAARPLADRLRDVVAEPVLHDGYRLAVTASVGWALADGPVTAAQLLHDADTAMYRAKRRP